MHERVLEEFLLQNNEKKQRIFSFFQGAPRPAKTGYLKGIYNTGICIISNYYVECSGHGIEVGREKTEKYTWQNVADKIENLISQGRYIRAKPIAEEYAQMSIFEMLTKG